MLTTKTKFSILRNVPRAPAFEVQMTAEKLKLYKSPEKFFMFCSFLLL